MAGLSHGTMIITGSNRTLQTMGGSPYGQLGYVATARNTLFNTGVTNVKEAHLGISWSLILQEDGTVSAMGVNSYGMLMDSSGLGQNTVGTRRNLMTNIRQIAVCHYTAYALDYEGVLWGWGRNNQGQLGVTSSTTMIERVVIDTEVKYVACAGNTVFWIKDNGDLFSMGAGNSGMLGTGVAVNSANTPQFITSHVYRVFTGNLHAFLVKEDNHKVLWGWGNNGGAKVTLSIAIPSTLLIPTVVQTFTSDIKTVVGGTNHTLILLTNNDLYIAGLNTVGQLGVSTNFATNLTVPLTRRSTNIAEVYCGSLHTLIRTSPTAEFGQVQGFGAWSNGQLTTRTSNDFNAISVAAQGIGTRNLMGYSNLIPTVGLSNQSMSSPFSIEGSVLSSDLTNSAGTSSRFRVLIEGQQAYPTDTAWTEFQPVPQNMSITLSASLFNLGNNKVSLVAEDENYGQVVHNFVVEFINYPPEINGTVEFNILQATVDDAEGNAIRYRILVNNEQVYPSEENMSQFYNVPHIIEYSIPTSYLLVGEPNTVRLEVDDGVSSDYKDWTFLGDYVGLMFTDEGGNYYSDHIGGILEYLDLGVVVAGGDTEIVTVRLRSNFSYSIHNIRLIPIQRELDGETAKVEISKSDAPFVAEDPLTYSETLQSGEEITFYVRVTTNRQAIGGGMFDIQAKADPV